MRLTAATRSSKWPKPHLKLLLTSVSPSSSMKLSRNLATKVNAQSMTAPEAAIADAVAAEAATIVRVAIAQAVTVRAVTAQVKTVRPMTAKIVTGNRVIAKIVTGNPVTGRRETAGVTATTAMIGAAVGRSRRSLTSLKK